MQISVLFTSNTGDVIDDGDGDGDEDRLLGLPLPLATSVSELPMELRDTASSRITGVKLVTMTFGSSDWAV